MPKKEYKTKLIEKLIKLIDENASIDTFELNDDCEYR